MTGVRRSHGNEGEVQGQKMISTNQNEEEFNEFEICSFFSTKRRTSGSCRGLYLPEILVATFFFRVSRRVNPRRFTKDYS